MQHVMFLINCHLFSNQKNLLVGGKFQSILVYRQILITFHSYYIVSEYI